jgi:hypothetical protein
MPLTARRACCSHPAASNSAWMLIVIHPVAEDASATRHTRGGAVAVGRLPQAWVSVAGPAGPVEALGAGAYHQACWAFDEHSVTDEVARGHHCSREWT